MGYDFPASPTNGQVYLGYTYDGEKWVAQGGVQDAVRYGTAQGLTSAQMSQGRANIAVTKKNYVINGGMQVSQENGTTSIAGGYPADMFSVLVASTGTVTTAQVLSAPSPAGGGRLRVVVGTADTSIAAGEAAYIVSTIEGQRISDLRFGNAAAKTFTLQFGVRAPTGTYSVAFLNAAINRSFVAEYVVSAGEHNIDTVKSITVAGDTIGTWATDNTGGVLVRWCLMAGTTYQQAAGTWGTGNAVGSPNQYNWMGTASNNFELFDVSLTEGNVAPPFQLPDYASELALCQRYYQKLVYPDAFITLSSYNTAGSQPQWSVPIGVEMRANPTAAMVGVWSTVNCSQPATIVPQKRSFGLYVTVTAAAYFLANNNGAGQGVTLNARL